MKEPKLARDWPGTRVMSIKPFRNGFMELPARTKWTVTHKHDTFSLESDPCLRCGIKVFITKISRRDFVLLNENDENPEDLLIRQFPEEK